MYDGLAGFMWHFCGAEPLAPLEYRAGSFTTVERVARRLWRKASRPNRSRLLGWRAQLASRARASVLQEYDELAVFGRMRALFDRLAVTG